MSAPGRHQRGVGLVEVMVALSVLVFGALVTAHMQVGALIGLRGSAFHLAIDRLSSEMIETLRTHARAAEDGLFDHAAASEGDPGEETGSDPTALSRTDRMTADWRARVKDAIPTGDSAIDCEDGFCTVEISWMEEIDGTFHRQFFRARTPI